MPGVEVTRENSEQQCSNCGDPASIAIEFGLPRRRLRFCTACNIRTGRLMLSAADESRPA